MTRASAILAALLACGCASSGPGRRPAGGPPEIRALLLNGGGTARTNYYSHVLHLGAMYASLTSGGIQPGQIDVLSSDGESIEPDVAVVRSAGGPYAWLLDGTVLERPLGRPVRFVSAASSKVTFARATRAGLQDWFDETGDQMRSGDTLLLFVTDHGEKGKTPAQNRITLWNRESITVAELGKQLARLPHDVRVVTVMSQCYSGGFAEAALDAGIRAGRPAGTSCGYYSTTADRQAFGCYPDVNGEDDGYAIRFAQGLARSPSLRDAHAETLSTDRTPDVPVRSSDLFLARVVDRAASRRRVTAEELISSLTPAALDAAGASDETRAQTQLLEQVARSFAIPVPRQPGELAAVVKRLETLRDRLNQNANSWESAVGELAQANLDQFLAGQGGWADWMVPRELARLNQSRLTPLQERVVADLAAFTRKQPGRLERLQQGRIRLTAGRASRDRSEVRMAALLRLRTLLTSLVGQHLLSTEGTPANRTELAALRGCEDLRLPRPNPAAQALTPPPDFPSIDNDERLAIGTAPASLGAVLAEVTPDERSRQQLPAGAMTVVAVDPGSPAEGAGLAAGDILLGEVGAPAVDRGALKLQLAIGQNPVRTLDVRRNSRPLVLATRMKRQVDGSRDKELPAAGRMALRTLTAFRGDLAPALTPRKPVLLFFWATWCTFCKFAVPELMALERERGISVLSITDESANTIKQFLGSWGKAFPQLVALDPDRKVNEVFEVEGYPTFLLVDERGRVRMHSVGYRRETGLPIDGWRFAVEGGVER